jgi:choline dehydrogenase
VAVEFTTGKGLYGASRAPNAGDIAPVAQRVAVTREVILCAGAFNSPQLLMLSGIGPAEELARLGIDVKVDLPGVGQNLQDRYEVGVVSQMERPFTLLSGASFTPPAEGAAPDAAFSDWLRGKGLYTCNGAAIAVMKRSDQSKVDPDLFIFGLPTYFKGYYPGYSDSLRQCQDMFTWAILKAHTVNTAGEVALTTSDPRIAPAIRFRYFDEGSDSAGEDLQAVVEGVLFAREINKRLIGVGMTEVWPGSAVSTREQVAEFIKNEAWGHHASCTNKIGADGDKMAVLDHRFRVRGTTGLRVVDASIFPRIPGFFIVSAIYMIAEKASEDILGTARGEEWVQAAAATAATDILRS